MDRDLLLIPRNAVAPRSVSSPTAVPRRRGRCPLEVASRFGVLPAQGWCLVATLDALPTDKVVLSGSTRVAQSLLSRFHGRMSAAALGRSPSRRCSIGEFRSFSPRCRVENSPFLPWVLVLFQVLQHVAMPAARRTPLGIHRPRSGRFRRVTLPPESLLWFSMVNHLSSSKSVRRCRPRSLAEAFLRATCVRLVTSKNIPVEPSEEDRR